MNTQRWIYVGVLGLSVLALLIDRVFFSTPASVEAASILPPGALQAPIPAAAPAKASPATPLSGGDPIVELLRALPVQTMKRDMFALSGVFLERSNAAGPTESGSDQHSRAQAASFSSQHKLQTTLIGEQAMAVVDGQVLHMGDIVDGLSLCRIESNRAAFCNSAGTEVAVLTLDPAAP